MNSLLKHILMLVLTSCFFLNAFIYAQDLEEIEEQEKKESNIPYFPITISKFRIMAQYYGLPISIKAGYFYRKRNTSIFPNIAVNLFRDNGLILNASTGFVLQTHFFTWQIDAIYDILPFTMNKGAKDQVSYAVNSFSFNINGSRLSLVSSFGNKRRFLKGINEPIIDFETSQGIVVNAFLLDIGYFRSTLFFSSFVNWLPSNNFVDYNITLGVPATFNLYYVDVSFMYSYYNTGELNNENAIAYTIEKPQSQLTGRDSFKNEELYSMIHLFGLETRWYPTRTQDKGMSLNNNRKTPFPKYNTIAKTNGFFLSLFADSGFAMTKENKYNFIGEYGIGLGYNLFDCVPFTFQIGINQRGEPVFFLGVVSRMTHLP